MTRRGSVLRSTSAAMVLAVGTLAAQGQDGAAGGPSARPTFRTEANYVRVDVFATRDGEPVTDLRPEDFQIEDEGVRQEITQFEYVQVRGNVPQEARREPTTVAESREMLTDPRARVFVLFLDPRHVDPMASRSISRPLVDTLEALIGVDDLIGVMTPDMSAADVTFARRTTAIQGLLDREWWGERDRLVSSDPAEELYKFCYPSTNGASTSSIAQELIERRREKLTFDALRDLVGFLRGAREERKAILVISEGWQLFHPNLALLNGGRQPQLTPARIDPATGSLTTRALTGDGDRSQCDRESVSLAMADTEQQFRWLLQSANRANASFYPIDPRGLVAFDASIGPDRPPSLEEDRARLRAKTLSLRTAADLTDGVAVVNTNNITENLQRVVADLSSYYLLGYYASGVEMDGKFHDVTVRVTRPGIEVRARRGYLAPGRDEVAIATAADTRGTERSPAEIAEAHGVELALGSLAGFSRELPLRIQVAAGWAAQSAPTFWITGEVGRDQEWARGASIDVAVTGKGGDTLATTRLSLEAGTRNFDVTLRSAGPAPPGDYTVRARARGAAPGSLSTSDVATVSLSTPTEAAGARFFRRGPTTGNRDLATADLRFRRNERLRVEFPSPDATMPTARVLDRAGQPLPVPVITAARDDGDGQRWATAELTLAPLAPGDYVLEMSGVSGETERAWIGFRLVP